MQLSDLTNPVYVELAGNQPIRIFRDEKAAAASGLLYGVMEKAEAVKIIRAAIFTRDNYECTHCGQVVVWDENSDGVKGDMHEMLWRGRGGEISVANGRTLCHDCHMNSPVAGHGDRKPQWSANLA